MARLRPGTIRLLGRIHAWLWRPFGGMLGYRFGKAPFLLLTTTGRRSGRPRTTPVLYFRDGSDLIIVASFGGNDIHPAWYWNLTRFPEASVLIEGRRLGLSARQVSAEEKKRIWPRLIALYPNFDLYQRRTRREIPLMRLSERP